MSEDNRHIAFICSKGDLDMAYPALVMGWAALGNGIDVTIFFTFWGMDIINKKRQATPGAFTDHENQHEDEHDGLAHGQPGHPQLDEHHPWDDGFHFLVHEEKNRRSRRSTCW